MNASRQVMLETARGPVAVTPGVIDDEAEYAYRNGQCIALSLALAKETGWPIVVQLSKPGDPWWEEKTHGTHIPPEQATAGWMYHFVHSLVMSPERTLLDISGEYEPDDFWANASYRYGSTSLVALEPATLKKALADVQRHGATFALDERTATAFAAPILRDYTKTEL